MSLAVLVPSKGRPLNAGRLARAVRATHGAQFASLTFALDHDERFFADYLEQVPLQPGYHVETVFAQPQRIGPILNLLVPSLARHFTHVGFMGDDHLPRTLRWDEQLVDALGGRPGVAYGNDLVQGEAIPTAAVISADIVTALGYFVPPGLEHLYFDDFWKALGLAVGNLAYLPDVTIEHLHPTAGTADWDDGYRQANDPEQFSRDKAVYDQFLTSEWPVDFARLKQELGL